jgi:hypothetical protein
MSSELASSCPYLQNRSRHAKQLPEIRDQMKEIPAVPPLSAPTTSNPKSEPTTNVCTTGQTHFLNSSNILYCRAARALFRGSPHALPPNGLGLKSSSRKRQRGVSRFWIFRPSDLSSASWVSNFLLFRSVLRHFWGLGRPDTVTHGHSGPKDSFLSCGSKI